MIINWKVFYCAVFKPMVREFISWIYFVNYFKMRILLGEADMLDVYFNVSFGSPKLLVSIFTHGNERKM